MAVFVPVGEVGISGTESALLCVFLF